MKGPGLTLAILLSGLATSAIAQPANPPATGVYECFGVGVSSGPTIGLIDASTYRSRNGQTGHYSFNPANLELTLTSGPLAGVRYRMQLPYRNLRVLDGETITTLNCPRNSAKDPNHLPW
jgi:hypothetical protein